MAGGAVYVTIAEFLQKIDWKLLNEQLERLAELQSHLVYGDRQLTYEHGDALDGVVNLLGALKDFAVDDCGLPEPVVFTTEVE